MTVHSHGVESFEGLLYSDLGEGGVAVNCKKTQFLLKFKSPRFKSLIKKSLFNILIVYSWPLTDEVT